MLTPNDAQPQKTNGVENNFLHVRIWLALLRPADLRRGGRLRHRAFDEAGCAERDKRDAGGVHRGVGCAVDAAERRSPEHARDATDLDLGGHGLEARCRGDDAADS
jgi:hypothetical protein